MYNFLASYYSNSFHFFERGNMLLMQLAFDRFKAGAQRHISSVADLRNSKIGVSRIGSGSYVMGLCSQTNKMAILRFTSPPFDNIPLQTFEKLRNGVNDGTVDSFYVGALYVEAVL